MSFTFLVKGQQQCANWTVGNNISENWCDLIQNTKEAVSDDILPDGTIVRKGDAVLFHAYGMGRMPYIWGPDAGDFKPERWIKDGVFRPESHFKYIAFQVSLVVTSSHHSLINIKSNDQLLS